jgi:hypothetical protein
MDESKEQGQEEAKRAREDEGASDAEFEKTVKWDQGWERVRRIGRWRRWGRSRKGKWRRVMPNEGKGGGLGSGRTEETNPDLQESFTERKRNQNN